MPIMLDNLQASTPTKIYSPKFFDSKLTGSGKKMGVLNEYKNPINIDPAQNTISENIQTKKRHFTNGSTEVTGIPVNILSSEAWEYMNILKAPSVSDMQKIGTFSAISSGNCQDADIYLVMYPHSIVMEETHFTAPNAGSKGGVSKKITPCYHVFLFGIVGANQPLMMKVDLAQNLVYRNGKYYMQNAAGSGNTSGGTYWYEFTCNPLRMVQDAAAKLRASGAIIDDNQIANYINNYSLYDAMCKRSEEWQSTIDQTLDEMFYNVVTFYAHSASAKNQVAYTLRRIEDYNVPLDLYRNIYASITKHFNKDDAVTLCKQNLNLLLSDTLNNLDQNKSQLTVMPTPTAPVPLPTNIMKYSLEQQKAITTNDPLVLVQAGAGTGKALPLTTPVLTPNGWVPMGNLNVGDEVIGSNGKPTKVLRIHEQGLKDGYHLTFRDGSSVDACKEHLWTLYNGSKNEDGKPISKTVTTEQWVSDCTPRKRLRWAISKQYGHLPITQPVEYAYGEKDLPVDPYLLGILLSVGNCHVSNNGCAQYTEDSAAVTDETRKAAARNGFTMIERPPRKNDKRKHYSFQHDADAVHHCELNQRLDNLGLNGLFASDMFIPDTYKTASIGQRTALIQGLFDGSGYIPKDSTCPLFKTESSLLREDVLQLLWSLGLSATVYSGDSNALNPYERKHGNSVMLMSKFNPFLASKYHSKKTGAKEPMRRWLVKAEPIQAVPMRCIEVDAPDKLYVTQDFIVTHNSTVILGRIAYMIAAGVNPSDITVLSFTNAAADHITEKNPDIHSMTIARMIHSIYTTNFADHELSSIDTIMNSLDIYFPNDDMAMKFKSKCKAVAKNDNDGFTSMNNFIEKYYDDVIRMLNTIHQTSLELEIIICYQKIDQFAEPPEVQSKYLIIDEVQDNSIFEFIYTLKYVDKHKESLFIVGKLRLPTQNPTNCGKPTHMSACA